MRMRQGLLIAGLFVAATLAAAQSTSKVIATVNGENITEQQMMQAAAADLSKLDANRPQPQAAYDRAKLEVLWRALNAIIEDKLIAAGAGQSRMSRDAFLNAEVESNVETPSPQEVEEYYEANKAAIPIPRADALPQIRQGMIESSRRGYRNRMLNNLRRTFKVTTTLDPLRTDVATAGYPSRGPANAPVTMVEFGDFQCPYCGAFYPVVKQVEQAYAGRMRLVFRQFPLTNMHPDAQKSAEAALCANDQGRFWEFYDSLFSDQSRLDVPSLKQRAQTLGLNTNNFNTCLDSGKQADTILKDKEDARRLGVSGTPTVFINGRLLTGRSFAEVQEMIEDELKRAAGK